MAFKMRGTPMQRNFGIPLKNVETRQDATKVEDPIIPEVTRTDKRGLIETKDEGMTTLTGGKLAERRTTKDSLKTLHGGRSAAGKEFDKAFAKASKEGKETFTWRGKTYTTEKASKKAPTKFIGKTIKKIKDKRAAKRAEKEGKGTFATKVSIAINK